MTKLRGTVLVKNTLAIPTSIQGISRFERHSLVAEKSLPPCDNILECVLPLDRFQTSVKHAASHHLKAYIRIYINIYV